MTAPEQTSLTLGSRYLACRQCGGRLILPTSVPDRDDAEHWQHLRTWLREHRTHDDVRFETTEPVGH